MRVEKVITGQWRENCYIIHSVQGDKVIIIDPGADADKIKAFIKKGLRIAAILNTHAHYDHIGAVHELIKEYSCPFYLHSKDKKLLESANMYSSIFDGQKINIPNIDCYYDKIPLPLKINDISIDVIFTPGHTNGSVCIRIDNMLFTGDLLFKGAVGRTDLPGGNKRELNQSLILLSKLSKDIIVYPGHGDSTILGTEIKSIINKGLIVWDC